MITLEQIREKFLEELKQNLKHMTQKQLAEKIGVSQQAIAQYLHQKKLPALDTFANLCIALDFHFYGHSSQKRHSFFWPFTISNIGFV